MTSMLARNWWAFVARGILAILFGLIALFTPGVTMFSLVLVFAGFSVADGVLAMVSAIRAAQHGERWSLLVLEGITGVIIGAAAAALPGITVIIFIALVAAWAIITGSFMLSAGFELDADHGRWWLVLGGAASIVWGGSGHRAAAGSAGIDLVDRRLCHHRRHRAAEHGVQAPRQVQAKPGGQTRLAPRPEKLLQHRARA